MIVIRYMKSSTTQFIILIANLFFRFYKTLILNIKKNFLSSLLFVNARLFDGCFFKPLTIKHQQRVKVQFFYLL